MESLTILLVDEHEGSRTALRALLTADGHHVIATGSWDTALRLASEGPFDLLLCELSLPDRFERDLMAELAHRYGTRGILLTGFEEQLAGGWRRAGFSHYLYKPVSYQRIASLIRRIIPGHVPPTDCLGQDCPPREGRRWPAKGALRC